MLLIGEVGGWLLVPRLRIPCALVRLRLLTTWLPEERVWRRTKAQDHDSKCAVLSVRIRCGVLYPVEAFHRFARGNADNGEVEAAMGSQDEVQKGESQFVDDITPTLVDDLWGVTVGA